VLKLLIVDDEYEIRTTLAVDFPWDRVGFVVAGQAASAREAIALTEGADFDAVLCDIRMGADSGLDFARWSRERDKGYRIVLLSAYRKFEYAQEALAYGIRGYIVKPPNMDEVLEIFGELRKEIEAEKAAKEGVDPVAEIVVAYVEGNYAGATIREAARIVRMNSHYLSTYYKEKRGETFTELLVRTRMRKAAELLLDGRYRTQKIGAMIGYSDPKNFARAFRRYHGMPPREFKRSRCAGTCPAPERRPPPSEAGPSARPETRG
jgi:YesN/AraC family two-component response regulator